MSRHICCLEEADLNHLKDVERSDNCDNGDKTRVLGADDGTSQGVKERINDDNHENNEQKFEQTTLKPHTYVITYREKIYCSYG